MNIVHLSEPVHGWIDITFGQEPDCYTLTASDVPNDCLRDLPGATSRLLQGSTEEIVEFSLEPDFARCLLRRDSDSVSIVIHHPDHDSPVFAGAFPLQAFARRVRFELLRIEPRYSADDGWTQPFPDREVADLA